MSSINHKWVILSVLIHAAALFGAGLGSGPLEAGAPAALSVTLLPSLPEEAAGEEGPAGPPPFTRALEPEMAESGRKEKAPDLRTAPPRCELSVEPRKASAQEDLPADPEETGMPTVTEPGAHPDAAVPSPEPADAASSGRTEAAKGGEGMPRAFSPGTGSRPSGPFLRVSSASPADGLPGGESGAGYVPPQILSLPEPPYPPLSRRIGEEGRVVVEVKIGAEGRILGAEVIESSSHSRLDRAALKAAGQVSFRPATASGAPVESRMSVAYRFELEGR